MAGKSLWWFFTQIYHLGKSFSSKIEILFLKTTFKGLLEGCNQALFEFGFYQTELDKVKIPGLPYVLCLSHNVRSALLMSANFGHEIAYCGNSQTINYGRIMTKNHITERKIPKNLLPYWYHIRSMTDVRRTFFPHLLRNFPLIHDVSSKNP